MAASASSSILPPPPQPPTSPSSWSELLPDLLGLVLAHLPLPTERARFRAVCRAWRAAVRDHHVRQLPWVVLPDGSFFVITGDDNDDDGGVFFDRLPGLPPDPDASSAAMTSSVVVGSTDDWLLLDRACDEKQLRYAMGKICSKCCCCLLGRDDDGKHKPSFLLQNAFTGATVPLPELEAVITSVSRRFQIRKALMRSSATPADDVIAVVTNNWKYNIVLCRPGKGTLVLQYYDIFDVAFVGDWLYGITLNENLIGFRLADGDDGKLDVVRTRRFITNPLPEGEEDYWSWINEEDDEEEGGHGGNDNDDGNDNEDGNGTDNNDEDVQGDQEEEADDQPQNQEEAEEEGDDQAQNKEEEDSSGGEEENDKREDEDEEDDEARNTEQEEDCTSGDGTISNGMDLVEDKEDSLNEPKKDYIIVTSRKLVKSRAGELLMVRRQMRAPSDGSEPPHTCKVEIFKADIDAGKWLPVTGSCCLAEDEALFLGKSFSKSVRVYGDIRARFIYFDDTLEAFDTTSSTCTPSSHGALQVYLLLRCRWLTWIFPQQLVV